MNILLVRLPARSACDGVIAPDLARCAFALASKKGARFDISKQGYNTLQELSTSIATADRVVLLLSAADVALLYLAIPPLSATKLRAALPNLAEEYLLEDPADCVVVCSDGEAPQRLLAVTRRDWLNELAVVFTKLGAKHLQAIPAQLCLPVTEEQAVQAALQENAYGIDLSVRLSAHNGIGLLCAEPTDAFNALNTIAPNLAITLTVPAENREVYAELAGENITVVTEDWSGCFDHAEHALDLMASLPAGKKAGFSLQAWRWPIRLALTCVAVNVVGLNLQWWLFAHESRQLREAMSARYRAAFPNESVVVDPLAQAQQKITLAEQATGRPAADSFVALSAGFGSAWSTLDAPPEIAELDYRDRHLQVRFKNAAAVNDLGGRLDAALETAGLSLSRSGADTIIIGSRK